MMSVRQIFQQSRKRLFSGRWFARMFLVFVLLNFLGNIAVEVTGNVLGVRAFLDKLESPEAVETISRAEFTGNLAPLAFVMFLFLVFRGIGFFGMASVSLKTARRDEEKWCGDSMAGFIRPIGLAWFTFAVMARILFWTLLFVVPGIVAAYRYSQAWYLKVEHPDWSVSGCLAGSGEIMYGYKKKRLCLDLYFLGVVLLVSLAVGAVFVSTAFLGAAAGFMQSLSMMVGAFAGISMMLWYELARAVFYENVREVPYRSGIADYGGLEGKLDEGRGGCPVKRSTLPVRSGFGHQRVSGLESRGKSVK